MHADTKIVLQEEFNSDAAGEWFVSLPRPRGNTEPAAFLTTNIDRQLLSGKCGLKGNAQQLTAMSADGTLEQQELFKAR